jgi:hypothetical protein
VAHTGFLTSARLLLGPEPGRRTRPAGDTTVERDDGATHDEPPGDTSDDDDTGPAPGHDG